MWNNVEHKPISLQPKKDKHYIIITLLLHYNTLQYIIIALQCIIITLQRVIITLQCIIITLQCIIITLQCIIVTLHYIILLLQYVIPNYVLNRPFYDFIILLISYPCVCVVAVIFRRFLEKLHSV